MNFTDLPGTFSHPIDSNCPLGNSEIAALPECQLIVDFSANEGSLGVDVHSTWFYFIPEDIAIRSRFADIVVPPPKARVDALPRNPRTRSDFRKLVSLCAAVNMANFHKVVAIDTATDEGVGEDEDEGQGAEESEEIVLSSAAAADKSDEESFMMENPIAGLPLAAPGAGLPEACL